MIHRTADAFVRAEPDETGFSPERLLRVSRFIEAEIESRRLPGAVLGIMRGDRLVGLDAFGHRDPVARVPMTTDSLFWIASMTKPITAVGGLGVARARRIRLGHVDRGLPATVR
jgi:CubicO group peptidase (beta-lactamase class C family)